MIAIVNKESHVAARHLDVVGRADLPEPRKKARPSSTVRRLLGGHMRGYRKAAGLTLEQVALGAALGSDTKISRIETGSPDVTITRPLIQGLLNFYGVVDPHEIRLVMERVDQILTDAADPWWAGHDGVVPGQFGDLVTMEPLADRITDYQSEFVTGLLQVPDYMDAVLQHPCLTAAEQAVVDLRRKLRLERQHLLRGKTSLVYTAIIDEAVLRRPVGGPSVMREQLRHLYNLAENRGNIHIRVYPSAAWEKALPMTSSLTLLQFPTEQQCGDMLYEENAGRGGAWLQEERVETVKASLEQLREHALDKEQTLCFLDGQIKRLV